MNTARIPRVLVFVFSLSSAAFLWGDEPNPESVFEERLMPIFNSPDPSSCVQCHLSSVDIKDYILTSSRDTFLSLRDQGLIDTDHPAESKILHLISMGDSDPDSLSRRIHAKNRKAEYEAFSYWIKACCTDEKLLNAKAPEESPQAGPSHSNEIIRHTRKDRLLDSFVRNIWSQRMRCFPCHTPAELQKDNPLHKKPIERHKEFVKTYGVRMNVFKETPLETMRSFIASSRKQHGEQLPLINVENPADSLLLLKPTAKLPPKGDDGKLGKPSSRIPVSHMGGIKIHKGDQSYKSFVLWLQDYADSVSENYQSTDTLPDDNWYPTEHVIRVKNIPDDWPNLATVQVFVHRWNQEREDWSESPVAFTQSLVTPRKFVNGSLFVLANADERESLDPEGVTLRGGKVQLRIYLDREQRLATSPTSLLNDRSPDATATFEAKFGKGFKNADVVDGVTPSH